jgi:predicted ester cyclase
MNSASNKDLIALYLSVLSGKPKTPDVIREFVSDPHLLKHIEEIEAAFPAYELIPEQMIGENDLVAVRGMFRGTHRGPFAGVAPTGKTVSAGLIIMYRIRDGRIVEYWLEFDMFGLMQQLRSLPAAATA